MVRDEKEGGTSSGNDDDDAEGATAATAEMKGTLSLHNTFMDVVIRYVCARQRVNLHHPSENVPPVS